MKSLGDKTGLKFLGAFVRGLAKAAMFSDGALHVFCTAPM